MMFMVIFASLAAAMAIVSQGNLSTADANLKINRALAAAETGMHFVSYRLAQVASGDPTDPATYPGIKTRDGVITPTIAQALWNTASGDLVDALTGEGNNIEAPYLDGDTVHLGPIAVGPDNAPKFTATLTPHPLPGEDYDSPFYQRPPYADMTPKVSNANPLDASWIRVKVVASDGPPHARVYRSISTDFRITKRIPYAILSKNRVMIGRNVMIDGPIGSRFLETHLPNGHPIQMASDFRGLNSDLNDDLDALTGSLITNDIDGDNRINVNSATETDGISNPEALDTNNDGYIDEYDFFLSRFDTNADGRVSTLELEDNANDSLSAKQLLELIDTFGSTTRDGYNDGFIDNKDRYTKIRGEIYITDTVDNWNDGAAGGAYQDYFQGPIAPEYGQSPLTFQAGKNDIYEFDASDFDVTSFRDLATNDLLTEAASQAGNHDPDDPASPQPLGQQITEAVPYGAAHPYDFYDRPIFENMTFENVKIPKGTNALFRNCKFIGVTFIESETKNTDTNFNYAGMQESDGTAKHPDREADVDGTTVSDTKTVSNNIRFENCTFEGGIVSDAPEEFTHVRNKIAFTGTTRFEIDESTHLSATEKQLFKRSTILAPNYSVEMGTFISPYDSSETVELSGTIVAGIIDMRGQVKVNGTILTTFEPKSNEGPVIGETSPQFNTTLGYFGSDSGDLEAELPESGVGVIQVRYDPTLPLPDGVLGPIQIEPVISTYFEGGQ